MYFANHTAWATVLLAFTIPALTMDNFLRPMLIRKGSGLPSLLILAGVVGGLIATGLLGIFLGATVLAVAYTLLNSWIAEADQTEGTTEYRPGHQILPGQAVLRANMQIAPNNR